MWERARWTCSQMAFSQLGLEPFSSVRNRSVMAQVRSLCELFRTPDSDQLWNTCLSLSFASCGSVFFFFSSGALSSFFFSSALAFWAWRRFSSSSFSFFASSFLRPSFSFCSFKKRGNSGCEISRGMKQLAHACIFPGLSNRHITHRQLASMLNFWVAGFLFASICWSFSISSVTSSTASSSTSIWLEVSFSTSERAPPDMNEKSWNNVSLVSLIWWSHAGRWA
mmetsp:Transcript_23210/g.46560  ORF Transcript_23210/g.46560 Transcript_23210/m.46560 type:complete len:224 (-) Transcript_23210:1480-2151(-)